jgi:hypothetical protein
VSLLFALVAAGVLAYAGAAKILDPTMTAGALRAMGLPVPGWLVRVGAVAEVALAVAAVVWGGAVLWALVGVSYTLFAAFVVVALVSGRPIGSCGCFGRVDIPPTWLHVVVNASLGAVASIEALEELSRATR